MSSVLLKKDFCKVPACTNKLEEQQIERWALMLWWQKSLPRTVCVHPMEQSLTPSLLLARPDLVYVLKFSDKIRGECCPAPPLLKHAPSNNIILQALVIWLVASCALRASKRRHTRRARNWSKARINSGFIKAVVQPRTNHFSLSQLKMLHIPSSPTENTADMSLSAPLRLACLLPLSRLRVLLLGVAILVVSLRLWTGLCFFYFGFEIEFVLMSTSHLSLRYSESRQCATEMLHHLVTFEQQIISRGFCFFFKHIARNIRKNNQDKMHARTHTRTKMLLWLLWMQHIFIYNVDPSLLAFKRLQKKTGCNTSFWHPYLLIREEKTLLWLC